MLGLLTALVALASPAWAQPGPSPVGSTPFAATGSTTPRLSADRAADVVNVLDLGVLADGVADDWALIQAAIDAGSLAGGRTILVPPVVKTMRVSQALRLRSNVTLLVPNPNTTIRCTGDAGGALGQWPVAACVSFGAYEANVIPQLLTPYPISAVAAGDGTITFTGSGAAADFAVNDVVTVETVANFAVDSGTYRAPDWRQINRVTAINTGANTVSLAYPVQAAVASAQMFKLTNGAGKAGWPTLPNTLGADTGIPLWASYNSGVVGGTWVGMSTNGAYIYPFATGSGALDCRAQPAVVVGLVGVGYGNLYGRCTFSADRETLYGEAMELSAGSHNNTVNVGDISFAGTAAGARYVGVNEGSRGNSIHIGTLHVGASNGGDVIQIGNASGNKVRIDAIDGRTITGSVVSITSGVASGTDPGAKDNTVSVGASNIGSQLRYTNISGPSLSTITTGNMIKDSRFHGTAIVSTASHNLSQIGPGNTLSNLVGDSGSPYCNSAIGSSMLNVVGGAPVTSVTGCILRNVPGPTSSLCRGP